MEKIIIFDTTLRDGEQSPGASLAIHEKLEIARQLEKLNVDVIEAGYPISSPAQFEATKLVAQEIKKPIIAGLARALEKDVDVCWDALKSATRPRIHAFIGTSRIHMEGQLKKTPTEVLSMAVKAVKAAKRYTSDVEFSAMDAVRSEIRFLIEIFSAVIEAGANTINIPDTVGYTIPQEFAELIQGIYENVPNIKQAVISVHCHNDLGMATANSLAAIKVGARQVEGTINGLGERAGNAALEEIVMAIKTRPDLFSFETGIQTTELYKTSRLVSTLTGIMVQPNKAIVGANAFAHEAGIHQDGVLKDHATYEIMNPESVGFPGRRLVLGRHSGRHGFRIRLEEMGYSLSDEALERAYQRFLEIADKKKEVFDEDLEAIVDEEKGAVKEFYHMVYIHTTSGNQTIPTATIKLSRGKEEYQEAACGDGPVDAAYRAIDKITGITLSLEDYTLKAVTRGKDALGEVTVKIRTESEIIIGRGTSTDIIEASVKAYMNAINRLLARRENRT